MKMRFAARLFVLVLVMMMAASSAMAVQYLTFEDIPGDWNNYESAVKWMNANYVPTSDNVWVDTDLLDGGQVAPGVFEFIADPAHAYQNPDEICAYLYIDVPGDILYVTAFEGNWATREYMLLNCVATDGMYVDIFFPSFDRDGKLLNTDRIYLYEYEVNGQWYYECVTFYFRYDGEETRSFLPQITRTASVKEAEATPVPEATQAPVATPVPVVTEEPVATPAPVVTEEPVATPEPEETEAPATQVTDEVSVTVTDDEAASIGIIGGADGPTSVIVAGSEGFTGFFGSVFSGVLSGIEEEVISTQTVPAETTEPTVPAPEDYVAETETYEEVTEVIEDEAAAQAEAPGGMLGFFSGVFGGLGN